MGNLGGFSGDRGAKVQHRPRIPEAAVTRRRLVPAPRRDLRREDAENILRFRDRGYDRSSTATVLWLNQIIVDRVLDEPDFYDPILDYVAINRAHEGDLGVFRRLTHWERLILQDMVGWELAAGECHPLALMWRGQVWDGFYEKIRRQKISRQRRERTRAEKAAALLAEARAGAEAVAS